MQSSKNKKNEQFCFLVHKLIPSVDYVYAYAYAYACPYPNESQPYVFVPVSSCCSVCTSKRGQFCTVQQNVPLRPDRHFGNEKKSGASVTSQWLLGPLLLTKQTREAVLSLVTIQQATALRDDICPGFLLVSKVSKLSMSCVYAFVFLDTEFVKFGRYRHNLYVQCSFPKKLS